jgi:predicted nicotinamide N-methyase
MHLKTDEDALHDGLTAIEVQHLLGSMGPLREDRVDLPGTVVSFNIARPQDFDHLLDAAAADPEQQLPYWADLWPSGVALAAAITRDPDTMCEQRVLELGCGLGVTAAAALQAGADLLATDYAPEALALCALNTQRITGRAPRLIQLNWRRPRAEFLVEAGAGFPVVLAADVLYEARDVDPLVQLIERIVAPGGVFWLAEPGRKPAARFLDVMREHGWSDVAERWDGPWPDPEDTRKEVVVTTHRLTRQLIG